MSLRRRGAWLLVAAFVLRLVQRQVSLALEQPYQGMAGLGQTVDEWLDYAIPLAMDVVSLAAVVAGGLLLAAPHVLRAASGEVSTATERVDA